MALELERMSECEALLMRILWEEDCDMSMHELMDEAYEKYGKVWAKQTVSTLLKRMTDAGYVSSYREGRIFYYHAEVKAKDYRTDEALSFVKKWFDGDVVALLEAVNRKKKLTKTQKERLKSLL